MNRRIHESVRMLVSAIWAVCATAALAVVDLNGVSREVATLDDDYTNTSDALAVLTVNVADGDTVDFNGTLSGNLRLEKSGLGTLKLNARSTYTGGTELKRGYIRVAHPEAVGATNTLVEINANSSKGVSDTTFYVDAPISFYNPMKIAAATGYSEKAVDQFVAADGSLIYSAIEQAKRFFVSVGGDVHFYGPITGTERIYKKSIPTGKTVHFHGPVKIDTYWYWRDANGDVCIYSQENAFEYVSQSYCQFLCGDENVFPETAYYTHIQCKNTAVVLDLQSFDQTLESIRSTVSNGQYSNKAYLRSTGGPARVTMLGTGDRTCQMQIGCGEDEDHAVTLAWCPMEGHTFTLTNSTVSVSPTTGGIVVSNGTFRLVNTVSLPNITFLEVGPNGVFRLQDSASAGNDETLVSIAAGGKLYLSSTASLTVKKLVYGNRAVDYDVRYQAKDGTDATATKVDWIEGPGVVYVNPATPMPVTYVVPAGTPGNTPQVPYDTLETAANDLASALTWTQVDGRLLVAAGRYEFEEELAISQKVSIEAMDDGDVVFDGCGRTRLVNATAEFSVSGVSFVNGKVSKNGGAIYADSGCSLANCTFTGNTATPGQHYYGKSLVCENCVFDGTGVSTYSTALTILSGDSSFSKCVFRNHSLHATSDGGVLLDANGQGKGRLVLRDTVVTNNACQFLIKCQYGAGLQVAYTNVLRNCLFADNDMGVSFARMSTYPTLFENCTVADNRIGEGGYYVTVASKDGECYATSFVFRNSIFFGNGTSLSLSNSSTFSAVFVACDFDVAGVSGAGVISASPRFDAAAKKSGIWVVKPSSPCCDAGVLLDWQDEASLDLIGNPRVVRAGKPLSEDPTALPDMGCCECVAEPRGLLLLFR